MVNQNNVQGILNQFGGVDGLKNNLNGFAEQFRNSTNQTPQQVGMSIQQQMSPDQFQAFAAIADMIVGKRR